MGLLDAPGYSRQQADAAFSGRPATLISKLARGQQNAVWTVLGDSTGNGVDEWVYLTAQWLAAKYPRYTVRHFLWNDTSQSYDAPTTVATGTDVAPTAVQDTYTVADGTTLSTGSLTTSGHAYSLVGGTWTVTGGKLSPASAGLQFLIASPRRDYTLTADFTFVTGASPRFFVRYADDKNHLFLEVGLTSMTLYKRQGNVLTNMGSASGLGITNGQVKTVSITAAGQTITSVVNGVTLTVQLSAYDQAIFLSPTTVGHYSQGTVAGTAIDNFTVTPTALTLDIYNASTPGMSASYSTARLATQVPVTPDLTVISYGHNETYQDIRVPTLNLIRGVMNACPRTQVAITAQNPRAATNGSFTDGVLKNQALTQLAAAEGLGLIDVFQRFADNSTYAADWLNADGLHPNSAGSLIWADEMQHFLLRTRNVSGAEQRPTRIFVPATRLVAVESTPTAAQVGAGAGLMFDPTTQQAAAGVVDIPSHWLAFNLSLAVVTPTNSGLTGSTNGIAWELTWGGLGFDSSAVFAPSSTPVPGQNVATATMSVNNTGSPSIYNKQLVTAGSLSTRPVALQVRRKAADAADTYAQGATLLGVFIERAA